MSTSNRYRRGGIAVAWIATVAVAAAGAWWGAQQTVAPPDDPLPEAEPATYTVQDGTVGRSMSFSATAEWDLESLGVNTAVGTVTHVDVEAGADVGQGEVLYRVDLRPVVVGQGTVPAFRDLARGAQGPDVEQLQALLADLGHLDAEPDGDYGPRTVAAVRSWQDDLGIDDDGVVRAGDIVWVTNLPARVALDPAVRVGGRLAGGEEAVLRVPDQPDVRISLSPEQRSLVPMSADVRVRHPDRVWEGRIARVEEHPDSHQIHLVLEGDDGGPICGEDCAAAVPIEVPTTYGADLIVIPETHGPVVPVSAVVTGPDGGAHVTAVGGEELPVTVLESSDGLAVVEGVEVGDTVLVFEPGGGGQP